MRVDPFLFTFILNSLYYFQVILMKDIFSLFLKYAIGFIGAIACVLIVGTDIDLINNIPLILLILLLYFVLAFVITKFRN